MFTALPHRSHDEPPRRVVLPIDRHFDHRRTAQAMAEDNAEYCPPEEARQLAIDLMVGAAALLGLYAAFVLGCYAVQIAGTALRGVW